MIDYTLIRSKRKTITLYVRNGKTEVRAPLKTPKCYIDEFVASKEKWIRKKLSESDERQQKREAFSLIYGDTVTYRGVKCPITAKEGTRLGFDDKQFYLPSNLSSDEIKSACIKIYRMLAKRDLTNKVSDFAKLMNVSPASVKITGATTRWGSCSGKKNISFSWRLIIASDDVIDYVVVHELAHLTEMNHSVRFWRIVENIIPDYKLRKEKLKELHKTLSAESWE